MQRQNGSLLEGCNMLDDSDIDVTRLLGLAPHEAPPFPRGGLFHRLSMGMSEAAANIATVFVAVAIVVGLLITATAMDWTQTAQLLCNTPTMIIEGKQYHERKRMYSYTNTNIHISMANMFHVRIACFVHSESQIGLHAVPDKLAMHVAAVLGISQLRFI